MPIGESRSIPLRPGLWRSSHRYKIAFKGKTVNFEVPDLSNVKLAPGIVREDEPYIGPIWDESRGQLFLLYKTAQTFLYLLNDDQRTEQYQPSQVSPDRDGGMRTSFPFYKDKITDRPRRRKN